MFSSVVIANVVKIEAKKIESGQKTRDLLDVSLAVQGRDCFFITATWWDKVALSIKENLTKGSLVAIIGDPIFSTYQKNNGEIGFATQFKNPQIKYIYIKTAPEDLVEPGEQIPFDVEKSNSNQEH